MISIIDDPSGYMSTPAVVCPKDDISLNKIVEGSVDHIERLAPGWWRSTILETPVTELIFPRLGHDGIFRADGYIDTAHRSSPRKVGKRAALAMLYGIEYDRRSALGHDPVLADGTPVHGYDGFQPPVTTIRVLRRNRVVGCIPRKKLHPRDHQVVQFQVTPQFDPMDPGADWHQVECFAMVYKRLTVDNGFTYETVLDATGVDTRLLEGIEGWRPSLS